MSDGEKQDSIARVVENITGSLSTVYWYDLERFLKHISRERVSVGRVYPLGTAIEE